MKKIRIEKPTQETLDELGVAGWSAWECEPKTFDWQYDAEEVAYVKEGHATVVGDGETVDIKAGDLVMFPSGLACTWTVHETIRKVYTFN